ncbi:MAG TPA: hypothetical protein VK826_04390 [Bacteroidia bacterium]|nr:hypothetical protein [Bacteroidia bacterium]
MKNIFLSFLMMLALVQLGAQEKTADSLRQFKNTIFVEILGRAGVYSLNYERIICQKNKYAIVGKIGVSYFPHSPQPSRIWAVPFSAGFSYGSVHCLELCAGVTWFEDFVEPPNNPSYRRSDIIIPIGLAYRFLPRLSRLWFRGEIFFFTATREKRTGISGGVAGGFSF